MPINNDTLKQQLAARAAAMSAGVSDAHGGAPPAGGPQGVFDVSNDGVTWHPAVRLRASTGTAFVITNGEATVSAAQLGATEYADQAEFRGSPPPADGTVFRIVSPPGEYRYSTSSGAGWADDGDTILKPDSVILGANGRAFTTRASAHAATFTAARAMRGLLVSGVKHVHIESHSEFGDGGGGIFDVKDNTGSAYASDDNGTQVLVGTPGATGASALIRRDRFASDTNAKWFGAHGNLSFSLTGNYINPASITGGTNDNAAIIAAAAFAVANKKGLYIPAGIYLFDSTQLQFSRGLRVFGDKGRTVIVSRINKPFVIGTLTSFCFEVGIKDIELLCYEDHSGSSDWVAVDLFATSDSTLDFSARGWDYHIKSVHANANVNLDVRGENYLSTFRLREMSFANSLPIPPRSGVACWIEGQINGSTFSSSILSPVTASLILKGGVRGNLGSTITIEDVTSDNCADAVIVEDGVGIAIRRIYAESCTNAVTATDCKQVDITNVRGGDTWVVDCQGYAFGESASRLRNVRSQPINRGASFGQAPKAVSTTNVGVLSLGHNYETGLNNRHPTCHHSQLDGRNLFANGDFSRWIGSVPWLWRNTPGYSPVFTKCGTGLSDTTKSAGVPYCCHVVGQTSGEFYVTPPLGDQYLGTTVAISIKCKLVAGYAGLTVKGNNPSSLDTTHGSRSVDEADDTWIECPDEAGGTGWRLITFMWAIDQDICDGGIALQMQTNSACDIYLSEIQLNFGVAVPRGYVPAREILGGNIGIRRSGLIEIESAIPPTITTDPITAQALVAGDRSIDTTGQSDGWRYNGEVWEAFGLSEEASLVAQIRAVDASNKIASLVLGADFTASGPWKARIGTDLPSSGAAQATVGTIRNRKAAVFASGATTMGYTLPVNCAEYWAVSRWDLGGNFANLESMVGGAGTGPRLVGSTGSTNLINDCTITRDSASSVAVDGVTRIWRATDAAAADARILGCYALIANTNWVGPIGLAMAVTTAFTAEEADAIYTLIKNYFAK